MFRGLSAVQIDVKGRITIPANYRTLMVEEASGSLIVTIDTESKCLLLYPFPQWQIIEEKLESLPSFQPAARRIQRLLMGHATEMELDRQGRILLPNLLRDYAEIDKLRYYSTRPKIINGKAIFDDKSYSTQKIDSTGPLTIQLKHFVDCIAKSKKPLTGGYEGLKIVSVLEAAQRSLQNNGKPVKLTMPKL